MACVTFFFLLLTGAFEQVFLLVHSQGSGCFANFGALEAGIALPIMLPNMPLLVIPFRGQIQKTLKAELTVVSFFSRVDPFMDFEGLIQREGLVAVLTDELLHAQVDALMLLEVAMHGEAPATGLALVWLLSRVAPHVHFEGGGALELLGAELACVRPGREVPVGPPLAPGPRGFVPVVAELTLQLRHLLVFLFLEGLLRRSLARRTVQVGRASALTARAPVFVLLPPVGLPHFSQLSGFLLGFVVVVRAPRFVCGILVAGIVKHLVHLHALGLAEPERVVSVGFLVALLGQRLRLRLVLGSPPSLIEQFRTEDVPLHNGLIPDFHRDLTKGRDVAVCGGSRESGLCDVGFNFTRFFHGVCSFAQ